jgi:large subunit ribosomal protein L21
MQYRVQEGQVLDIAMQSEAVAGSEIVLNEVLLVGGEQTVVGAPLVAGAQVTLKVVGLVQDDKIVVFRYKSKKRYRRRTGHRQDLTRVQVTKIEVGMTVTDVVAAVDVVDVVEEAKPAKKSRAKAAASA